MEHPEMIKMQVEEIETYIKKHRRKMKKDDFEKAIKNDFLDFNLKYPALFEKILDGTLEKNQFNFMLNMMSKVQNNELSDHAASVQVGQVLVDKYVKPNLKDKKDDEENN